MSETNWADKPLAEAEDKEEADTDTVSPDSNTVIEAAAEEPTVEAAGPGDPAPEEAAAADGPVAEAEVPEDAAPAGEPAVEAAGSGDPAPEETAASDEPAEEPAVEAASPEDAAAADEPAQAPAPPPVNPNHKWYILQTYSGFEHRVEKTINEKLRVEKLEHLVGEIFVPGEDVERVKNGKKRKTHVIYYPGYVLIRMELTDELWHLLMDIPRVSGFVGGNNKEPRPLEEDELGAIRSQMNQGMQEAVLKDEFEVGQQVIVIDGPFANFSGKVDEVNTEKGKLRVLISILGRSTPVELDFDKVKEHPDTA